jgi:predicted amidohydrolase YtcJ
MKTLLINSKVWLGNRSFADSIGFDSKTGKIIFAGFEQKADKDEYDEIINCDRKLILPSFWDGHLHFIKGSMVSSHVDLRNAATENDFIEGLRSYNADNKSGWIQGGYFSESNFKEKIDLNKEFLDDIISEVPLIISRFDTHSAFINSKAIEISGSDKLKDKFSRDELIQDANGNLTGEVKEKARDFILSLIPPLNLNEIIKIVRQRMQKFHSLGITSISDITLPEDLEVYSELLQSKLNLFVNSQLPFSSFYKIENIKNNFSQYKNFRLNCFKAFYDGSLSSKTALFHSNYLNEDHKGMRTEIVTSGEFYKTGFEIDKAGYQMCVHAIGDLAVTELLDFVNELENKNGKRDRRFRIEHAQHIRESDLKKFRKLNVIASVQPSHLFSDAKTARTILTDFTTTHNYKKLIDDGAVVAFGTDFPVVSENPFETIYFAMSRKAESMETFLPDLRISPEDCLRTYTVNNAYASFEEKNRGILREGYAADIIVTGDLFQMKEDEIKNAKVDMTFYEGKRVY